MPTIVKAAGPADILALVPTLVGMVPHESIVLVAFRGKRTCGAMPFDLPRSTSQTALKRFATTMVGVFCNLRDVDGVVTAVFTDAAFGSAPPAREFADVINSRLHRAGYRIKDSLCQAADGWGSYLDDEWPEGGHPLTDVTSSAVHAEVPALNEEPLPARIPDAPGAERARIAKRLGLYGRLADAERRGDGVENTILGLMEDLPLFAEHALSWSEVARSELSALLLFALQGPPARDLVMLQWAFGLEVGDRCWNGDDFQADADLMMGIGPRPDPERIHQGIDLLVSLASLAADDRRPPLLCMLAWLWWALGGGSRARVYLDEALTINPEYSMAQLLHSLMSNGRLPEWAFAELGRGRNV